MLFSASLISPVFAVIRPRFSTNICTWLVQVLGALIAIVVLSICTKPAHQT